MSGDCLGTRLMEASLSLSRICAEEASEADSPDSKLVFIQHAVGFLNTAYRFRSSFNSSFAVTGRRT
ncbi:MAG: hypothetical protein QM391_02375 [Bacillota bacterium]|nr:hypothetical protein [Bacillota bacterium]HOJ58337.1 hypothetical protein [Bacillota bacterium]HOL02659.1 hypothetical protein [Bacillota bacterium]HPO81131.1 hypothetical protein [Bacillota bacterium]HPU62274.1 hypothetical protein [Bacillota bacterium]